MRQALLDVLVGDGLAMLASLERVLLGLAQDRVDQEQDLAVARLAAGCCHILVHVGAVGAHRFDALAFTTIVSACAAANLRPRGEPPAWAITGWPCGAGPE